MKQLIRPRLLVLCLMLIPVALFSQNGVQIGGGLSGQLSFSQISSDPPSNFRKGLPFSTGLNLGARWRFEENCFVETGVMFQTHGARYRFAPDFGTQAGNFNFLVARSRTSMPVIPLWFCYSPKNRTAKHPLYLSVGASYLFNPWLVSQASIEGTYTGGTSQTLYTRTTSEVLSFSTFAVSGKVEYHFWKRQKSSLAASLMFQKGFSRIQQSVFEYSQDQPTYENRIEMPSVGDQVAVGLTYWYSRGVAVERP